MPGATLADLGVDFDDVTDQLEREGLRKFEDSWDELSSTVAAQPHGNRTTTRTGGRR